ncbi:MAG: hypothetical protein U0174_24660 [Polyangiaceae bacterium]
MNTARVSFGLAAAALLSAAVGYVVGRGGSETGPVVGSLWHASTLRERVTLDTQALVTQKMGKQALLERVEGTGTLLPGALRGLSMAPGRDGLRLRADSEWVYITPTDLLAAQAYDRAQSTGIGLTFGVDFAKVDALAKARLGRRMPASPRYERVRFSAPFWAEAPTRPALDAQPAGLRARAFAGADYLARVTHDDGTFRYEVRATTAEEAADYNWVRHAGTAWFLARAARLSGSASHRNAAQKALRALRTSAYQSCGAYACIGKGESVAELGASALGLLAFLEFDRESSEAAFTDEVAKLSAFLLAAQKPNGDFNHGFDRRTGAFVDTFRMYYSGEATLALARHAALNTQATSSRDAASRALQFLAEKSWHFPGSRYYVSEEHWTCLALEELWDKAPSEVGLRFCLDWAEVIRAQRIREGQGPDADVGASRVAPVFAPRLTPVASRAEALTAILAVLRRSGRLPSERTRLEEDVRASLTVLAKYQFGYGHPTAVLVANPTLMHGSFPTSRTLWDVRIDSVQHAGNAFLNFAATEDGVALVTR